jgi:hypothetical protein
MPVREDILVKKGTGVGHQVPNKTAWPCIRHPIIGCRQVVIAALMPPSENPMSKSFETGQSHAYAKDSCN